MPPRAIQRYLAHKYPPLFETLQLAYAKDPTVVLGGGVFLMSEVPLYTPSPPEHRALLALSRRSPTKGPPRVLKLGGLRNALPDLEGLFWFGIQR